MNSTTVQTRERPMETLDAVKDHANAVRQLVAWDRVGILCDEGPHAILAVLIAEESVVPWRVSASLPPTACARFWHISKERGLRCCVPGKVIPWRRSRCRTLLH